MSTNQLPEDEDVVLRMSPAHAYALTRILDLGVRMHMGQFEMLSELAREQTIKGRATFASSDPVPLDLDQVDRVDDLLTDLKALFGHPKTGNFGIGAQGVSDEAKRSYETLKALQQGLHRRFTPDARHSVWADGVSVRYASGEAPAATVEKR